MILALRVPIQNIKNTHQESSENNRTGRWKYYLVFFQIALLSEVVITVIYWAFLARPKHELAYKVCQHIIPLISLTIEFCLMATPVKMRHFLPSTTTGILYLVANFTFSKISKPVYKLTWKDANTAIFLGVALILYIITLLILTFLSKLKIKYFYN